jgi:hypothetical protein
MNRRKRIMFCYPDVRKPLFVTLCLAVVMCGQLALAGTHVATPAELESAIFTASEQRAAKLAEVERFLKSELGQQALQSTGLTYAKAEQRVAALSDEELARVAARSLQLQDDFVAGRLTNTHITYIIVAAVAVVLIIALAAA